MYEHFTEKAIKVIMLAQEEARRLRHDFVGTEQILLGLCGEGTGIAARVLRAQNIKLKDLRATVLGIIGKGSGSVSAETSFTPRAKKLFEFAILVQLPAACRHCFSSRPHHNIDSNAISSRAVIDRKHAHTYLEL